MSQIEDRRGGSFDWHSVAEPLISRELITLVTALTGFIDSQHVVVLVFEDILRIVNREINRIFQRIAIGTIEVVHQQFAGIISRLCDIADRNRKGAIRHIVIKHNRLIRISRYAENSITIYISLMLGIRDIEGLTRANSLHSRCIENLKIQTCDDLNMVFAVDITSGIRILKRINNIGGHIIPLAVITLYQILSRDVGQKLFFLRGVRDEIQHDIVVAVFLYGIDIAVKNLLVPIGRIGLIFLQADALCRLNRTHQRIRAVNKEGEGNLT